MLPPIRGHSYPAIDIVRSFEKATAREYKYILAMTDYFSNWVKAVA